MAVTEAEFDDFVQSSWQSLYRSALLLTAHDRERAEDLAQDAVCATYRARKRVISRATLPAYCQRALMNRFLSECRREPRLRLALAKLAREATTTEDPAHSIAETGSIVSALAALPAKQRAVIVLRFYLDLSVADSADRLGCSTGTIKTHTSRALASLRNAVTSTHSVDR